MEARKVSVSEFSKYFSFFGNKNIIENHISYFEKKLKEELDQYKDIEMEISLAHYPNFAAWIRLYSELICNSLYWSLFRYEGDWQKINEMSYGETRNYIIEKIKRETRLSPRKITENEIAEMKKSINLVINLRHSFQHWGVPNIVRALRYGSSLEEIASMLNPKNYEKTRKIFENAEALIKLLPQPTIIGTVENQSIPHNDIKKETP